MLKPARSQAAENCVCASPWSQPFTMPRPLSGQSCSRAPSFAPCSGQASFSPLWNGGGCPSLPLTLARREPVAEEGAALLLLQQGDCSTADQALLAASTAPGMHCKRGVERKAGSSLCWTHRAGGPPYQPWLQGPPPHGEYLHTAAHHALGTMLTPRCCKQGQSRLPAVGVENGGHEAPVHQPPMQPHVQQWVLPSQGCLLGTGSHRAVSPKGCWC